MQNIEDAIDEECEPGNDNRWIMKIAKNGVTSRLATSVTIIENPENMLFFA